MLPYLMSALVAVVLPSPSTPAPQPAAGVVSVAGTAMTVQAAAGVANRISVTGDQGLWRVDDVVPLTAGAGCAQSGPRAVVCTGTLLSLDVLAGDGDDHITTHVPSTGQALQGGPGDDVITVGRGQGQALVGGPGNDIVTGGDGADVFHADQVADGADVYDGRGGDDDILLYLGRQTPIHADLDDRRGDDGAVGEGDSVLNIDTLVGGQAADVLVGSDGPDHLYGWSGDDTVLGRGGDDFLDGGDGDDDVDGGDGTNTCRTGAGGDVLRSCHVIVRR